MSTETPDLGKLDKKIDKLAEELAEVKKEFKSISSLEDLLKELAKQVSPVSKIENILDSLKGLNDGMTGVANSINLDTISKKLDKLDDDLTKSKDAENIIKKIDDVIGSVEGLTPTIESIKDTTNTADLNTKLKSIIGSIEQIGSGVEIIRNSENTDIIGKKIDDLQQYIASLSTIEETVEKLSSSYTETQEIVGIIVRQLDDIERKYNKSIEEITEAVALMTKVVSEMKTAPVRIVSDDTVTVPAKIRKDPPIGQPLPDSVDGLMDYLIEMITPQTEAVQMATALEKVRDRLTTMIKGHTPVLFQFGKVSRELKSYPPTATLNENDIARLSKEIRGWRSKLDEMTKKG